MLIRFSVENFLSFKDEVEFSMVAGRTRKHKDHILTAGKRNDIRLLKTGVIYGANASGKSNLIKAMAFARDLIVQGTRGKQSIPVIPYRFDTASKKKPSKFQFEVKYKTKLYIYGFEVDSEQVHSEWLYEIRPASEKLIFERKTDLDGRTEIEFGSIPLVDKRQEQAFLDFTARGTRPNQLFLAESIERNISYFENIYNWFDKALVLIFPDAKPGAGVAMRFMESDEFKQKYRDILGLLDLGIDDINLPEFDFDTETRLPNEIKEQIKQNIREMNRESEKKTVIHIPQFDILIVVESDNQFKAYKFMTVHQIEHESRKVLFELTDESDGTQRLFELVPALIDLLHAERERVFVIDELDRCLHAHMTYNILDIFLTNSANKSSQMIVTTHEASLLDLDKVRRDEIWFIEKDRTGASSVYSLEEFAPRFDMDIEKGYLNGRFGAIPILPSYNVLEWAK